MDSCFHWAVNEVAVVIPIDRITNQLDSTRRNGRARNRLCDFSIVTYKAMTCNYLGSVFCAFDNHALGRNFILAYTGEELGLICRFAPHAITTNKRLNDGDSATSHSMQRLICTGSET
jgi:hypothetical protein